MKLEGGHTARKRFGQNFLNDPSVVDDIVRSIAPRPQDKLVEIGPGQGALTLPLLQLCPALTVIELDWDLVARLETLKPEYPELTIHQADALKFDFSQLSGDARSLRVVGNLPYNISTPLLFHLLSFYPLLLDMHFMLQKEVVERMAAGPGSKTYGRLSIMIQYFCAVDFLFPVARESFSPSPKVESAIVRLTPHATLPFPADDFDTLKQLVSICFQRRRKTLRNSLRTLVPAAAIESLDIDVDLTTRPDNIAVSDFVAISNRLTQYNSENP